MHTGEILCSLSMSEETMQCHGLFFYIHSLTQTLGMLYNSPYEDHDKYHPGECDNRLFFRMYQPLLYNIENKRF